MKSLLTGITVIVLAIIVTADDINICSSNMKTRNIQYFPNVFDCQSYTLCLGDSKFDMKCNNGLLYNSEIGACDFPENVNCEVATPRRLQRAVAEPRATGVCPTQLPELQQLIFIANTQVCQNYTICFNGIEYPRTCNPGLNFDVQTRACNTIVNARCVNGPPPQCPTTTGLVNVPHPYDCRHFYQCVDGSPFLRTCAPDLVFDVANSLNSCNLAAQAQCPPNTSR